MIFFIMGALPSPHPLCENCFERGKLSTSRQNLEEFRKRNQFRAETVANNCVDSSGQETVESDNTRLGGYVDAY